MLARRRITEFAIDSGACMCFVDLSYDVMCLAKAPGTEELGSHVQSRACGRQRAGPGPGLGTLTSLLLGIAKNSRKIPSHILHSPLTSCAVTRTLRIDR